MINYSQVKSPLQSILYGTVSFRSIIEQKRFLRIAQRHPLSNDSFQFQVARIGSPALPYVRRNLH